MTWKRSSSQSVQSRPPNCQWNNKRLLRWCCSDNRGDTLDWLKKERTVPLTASFPKAAVLTEQPGHNGAHCTDCSRWQCKCIGRINGQTSGGISVPEVFINLFIRPLVRCGSKVLAVDAKDTHRSTLIPRFSRGLGSKNTREKRNCQ